MRKLFRSRTDRAIAGVCGGFAQYFGWNDTTWLRLIMALLILAGGVSVWIYIICWLVIPLEPLPFGPIDEQ